MSLLKEMWSNVPTVDIRYIRRLKHLFPALRWGKDKKPAFADQSVTKRHDYVNLLEADRWPRPQDSIYGVGFLFPVCFRPTEQHI